MSACILELIVKAQESQLFLSTSRKNSSFKNKAGGSGGVRSRKARDLFKKKKEGIITVPVSSLFVCWERE